MSDKKTDLDTGKDKAQSKVTRNFLEWANVLTAATVVITVISSVLSILEFLNFAKDIPPLVFGVISSVISLGIVLYSVVFLYQRQQKQKKVVEDELREYERELLDQVNSGFSVLLEEKVG